jgi:hypothetical protein
MTRRAEPNDIQIDSVHGRAIRREIGERLRAALDAGRTPVPAQLGRLLERLHDSGARSPR